MSTLLKKNNHGKNKQELLDFMGKFNLVKAPQKARFQINYIWANDPINESKFTIQKHIGHIFTN
jgi:hypothetical protein